MAARPVADAGGRARPARRVRQRPRGVRAGARSLDGRHPGSLRADGGPRPAGRRPGRRLRTRERPVRAARGPGSGRARAPRVHAPGRGLPVQPHRDPGGHRCRADRPRAVGPPARHRRPGPPGRRHVGCPGGGPARRHVGRCRARDVRPAGPQVRRRDRRDPPRLPTRRGRDRRRGGGDPPGRDRERGRGRGRGGDAPGGCRGDGDRHDRGVGAERPADPRAGHVPRDRARRPGGADGGPALPGLSRRDRAARARGQSRPGGAGGAATPRGAPRTPVPP